MREAKSAANSFFHGKQKTLRRHHVDVSANFVHELWARQGGEGDPTREYIEDTFGKKYLERYKDHRRRRYEGERVDQGLQLGGTRFIRSNQTKDRI